MQSSSDHILSSSDDFTLRVNGLGKRYGKVEAVSDVSFTLSPGEILGLLGVNGAGKSTLIKILAGLVRPSSGQATLGAYSLLDRGGNTARAAIGALIEGPAFYPQLSGRRNLAQLARLRGVPPEQAEGMLERVGLLKAADLAYAKYSMGMKQRLGLAGAFIHGPRMVILDEPTNGLDIQGQEEIRQLIRELMQGEGASVLLCSHNLEEVAALSGRALLMSAGRVVLEQPMDSPDAIEKLRAVLSNSPSSTAQQEGT